MPERSAFPAVTLDDAVEVLDHMRIPVNSDERANRPGSVPYYGANGQQGWIDEPLFDEPLILLAEDGGNFDDFATRSIAYRIDGPSWVNNHAHIIRALAGMDQDFIFWSLVHKDIRKYIAGGTRSKLTQGELRSIEIGKPTLPEQRRIAEILDTVDEAIRKTEEIIAKLKQVKRGLLHDLLTLGIDDNGELRDPDRHPEQFKDSPLGRIPRAWEVLTTSAVCEAVIDCKNRTPPIKDSGHPVIRTPNIREGEFVMAGLVYTDAESYETWTSRGKPRAGDVLITREAPVGEVCLLPGSLGDACLGQRMMMYRPDPTRLHNGFMVVALQSQAVQKTLIDRAGGSTVGHVRVGDIRRLPVQVPPLVEQAAIAEAWNALRGRLAEEKRSLAKLRVMKQGLMRDLLTGRVRVTAFGEGTEQ